MKSAYKFANRITGSFNERFERRPFHKALRREGKREVSSAIQDIIEEDAEQQKKDEEMWLELQNDLNYNADRYSLHRLGYSSPYLDMDCFHAAFREEAEEQRWEDLMAEEDYRRAISFEQDDYYYSEDYVGAPRGFYSEQN